jgi:hypothetical protein
VVRALAGAQHPGDPAGFAALRETLQQSPARKKMIELRQQQKVLSREEQAEAQQEVMKLMKQAVQKCIKKGRRKCLRENHSQPEKPQPRSLISINRGIACISCLPTR